MNKIELEVMEKIHNKHYEMLCKVDEVCSKNGISYFLDSGTLLGAVRGQDFIPWDDDIDLCLKREDFDRLLQCKDDFLPYSLSIPSAKDGYFWDFTTRLYDEKVFLKKDSTESLYYKNKNCHNLFVDLFVLDNYPGGIKGKIQLYELMILYIMATGRRYKGSLNKSGNLFVDCLMRLLSTLGKLFSLKTIYKAYEKTQKRYNKKPCDYYIFSNISISFLSKKIAKKEWYDDCALVQIRGKSFPVPCKYDEKLTAEYGDYHALPPEEKRKTEHIKDFKNVRFESK